MLRKLMILANVAVLFLIFFVIGKDPPNTAGEWVWISAISVFLMLNIACMFSTASNKESWLVLYFKRKRLEEKKKIQALQLDDSSTIADELVAEGA